MISDNRQLFALIIAPAFFGYENDIIDEFQRQGYDVTYIDERPSNSALVRAICRVQKGVIASRIEKHYRECFKQLSSKSFDLVLVIKGEVVPRWFLEDLRAANPQAHFVYYSWDALSSVPTSVELLDLFDVRYSFDSRDVQNRADLQYLPLFYTEEFTPLEPSCMSSRRYSLSFVGTLHSERYAFVKRLFRGRARTYQFFYVQARWYFALVKYVTRQHRDVPWRDVSFRKLSRAEVSRIFRESIAVLDMPRRGQAGLTIRTFEVLASGAVLVTTNSAIVDEPFFDPQRIVVIPEAVAEESDIPTDRLNAIEPPAGRPSGFEKYSLSSWVRTISGSHVSKLADREI